MQPEGAGGVEQSWPGHAQPGMPDRGVDEENEPVAVHVGKVRMRIQWRRQVNTQALVQRVEPQGTAHRIARGAPQQRIQRFGGALLTPRA